MTRPAADRVKVEWSGTGTGTMTLGSVVSGFQGFPSALNGLVVSYSIEHTTSTEAEAGYGTYTSGTNTLTRTYRTYPTLGGSAVNFSAGTKHVRLTAISADIAPNITTTDPTVNSDISAGYRIGSKWINTSGQSIWECVDPSAGAANWDQINAAAGGASEVLNRRFNLGTGAQSYTLNAAHKGQRIDFYGAGNDATVVVPNSITGTDEGGGVWDAPYWWVFCESDVNGSLILDVAAGATVDVGSSTLSGTTDTLDTNNIYLLIWVKNTGGTAATYNLYQIPAELGLLAAKSNISWTTDVASATANKFAGWDGSGNAVLKDSTGDAAPTRITITSAQSPYTLTSGGLASDNVEILCNDGANNLVVVLPAGFSVGSWVIKRGAGHTGSVLIRGATSGVSIDGIAGPTNGINLPAANTSGVLTMDATDVARWEGPSTQATTSYANHDFNSNQAQNVVLSTASLANELSCADQLVTRPKFKDYSEEQTTPTITTNTLTLNLTLSNVFEVTLTDDVSTLTISNPPATGDAGSFTLILKQDGTGGHGFTWPASIDWAAGSAPTISAAPNAIDIYTFITTTAGTVWYGFTAGKAFA